AANSKTTPLITTANFVRIGSSLFLSVGPTVRIASVLLNYRTGPRLFRPILRSCFGGSLLFGSNSRQGVPDAVIPFVTGMLKYRAIYLHKRQFGFPRSCPRRGIFDREFVTDCLVAGTCEALDDFHVLAGAPERSLVVEVGCLDNQRISFPAAPRVAQPRADALWRMRTSVQRDDADFMEHLRKN